MRFVVFSIISALFLFCFDYYIYRNWKRFAGLLFRRLRWTLPAYRLSLFIMPLTLPAYFLFSRWWEVDPKLPRALFIAIWTVYYLPKFPIAIVLLIKDLGIFIIRLFDRFRILLRHADNTQEQAQDLDISDMKRMNRSEFLQKLGWSASAVPFVLVGYGAFRSLYDFQLHNVEIPIVDLPINLDGLRITQISDIHAGSFFSEKPVREAFEIVASLRPDIILVTGDYVNHDIAEFPIIENALKSLNADLGVFGCLGNHDHYADVIRLTGLLENTPVKLLNNSHHTIETGGSHIHLIGTDNTGFSQNYADLNRATQNIRKNQNGDEVRILLTHDPSFWDLEVRRGYPDIDITLSGHTHGGQIGFEFGPIKWSLARMAYPRWSGLYSESSVSRRGKQYLYINRGLGTVGPPIRIGIRPEITSITLRRI